MIIEISVQASATTLKQIIGTNAKWSWANNPSNLGALDDSLAKLENLLDTGFVQDVLASTLKELRDNYGNEFLYSHIFEFLSLTKPVEEVATEHARLMRMHKANQT